MVILNQMLSKYNASSPLDKINVIKEIVQEIILSGLARSDFFKHAAFYGGTSLRIFHNLDRFSEDLDFTLLQHDPHFNLKTYVSSILDELHSLGIQANLEVKNKVAITSVQSGVFRGNMLNLYRVFYPEDKSFIHLLHRDATIKIKIDLDTHPPQSATTEIMNRNLPYPYQVLIYDLPSLFASKLSAVLTRNWQSRFKGRDLYDLIYYVKKGIVLNKLLLQDSLVKNNLINKEMVFNHKVLMELLVRRLEKIDFIQASLDVQPFITNLDSLKTWSFDFFKNLIQNIIPI
jgi:predicted nucleotidyltransferase component of viral defense system